MFPLGLLSAKGFLLPFRGVRNIIKNSRVPLIKRVRKICHLQGDVIPEEFSRGSVVVVLLFFLKGLFRFFFLLKF